MPGQRGSRRAAEPRRREAASAQACDGKAGVASLQPYHAFDALWEEETVVQRAHGVIWKHLTFLLQQKVPGVQPVISPEDGEASFLVSMYEGPGR